jgi:hypothetical protein
VLLVGKEASKTCKGDTAAEECKPAEDSLRLLFHTNTGAAETLANTLHALSNTNLNDFIAKLNIERKKHTERRKEKDSCCCCYCCCGCGYCMLFAARDKLFGVLPPSDDDK